VKRPRVGLALPGSERPVSWRDHLAIARLAEDLGFDSIRLSDHVLYRAASNAPERGPLEVWTLLSALGAATSRVDLGPLVACTAFHPPGQLAKMAATVDEISGGRLVLGLGAGWYLPEFAACGLPVTERVGRFEDSFHIIRRLLAGERVTVRGRYWSADALVLLPSPNRRIPLLVGSVGERMLSICLPYVDWWNGLYSDYGNTVEGFAELHKRISAAAERAGRDPAEVARSVSVLVDDEPGDGQARIRPLAYAQLPDHLTALAQAGADEAILTMRTCTETTVQAVGAVLNGAGLLT
jgi:alkanesulfonate monooxygenase SsuD/methylene tetrahydromethanopterin reductase-like flavin-dependent oxidoreductase (luciferase family)